MATKSSEGESRDGSLGCLGSCRYGFTINMISELACGKWTGHLVYQIGFFASCFIASG